MFAHLHVHSCFSFLNGGSGVEALVRRAAACGYRELALTDTHGLYGAVRFHRACEESGIRPLIGVELYLDESAPHPSAADRAFSAGELNHFDPGRVHHPHGGEQGRPLLLLARDRAGYRNLCRIITEAQLSGRKGEARLHPDTLSRLNEGLICLTGGERGPVAGPWLEGKRREARRAAHDLRDLFGPDRLFIELQNRLHAGSRALMRDLTALSRELGVRTCATNGVHYAVKADYTVHDLLTCCRLLTTVDQPHPLRPSNAEAYLKSPRAMARLFRGFEEALEGTAIAASLCRPCMELGVYHFPDFPIPDGETHYSFLCKLCWDGARVRYRTITREVMRRMEHELDIIEGLGFAQYFLVMWDIVSWARRRGIRCAGRGSAADSLVTYVLGITEVDPLEHELLFERFLNPQRKGAPDIDIDFDANRRDEVINYVYERYGRQHAAMVCTLYTLNARSAIREAGKALDFPPDELNMLARAMPHTGADRIDAAFDRLPELRDSGIPRWKFGALTEMCGRIAGFPRHLSVHLGGMVVSRERLDELVPLEWSSKGVVVTQWDKDDIEQVGLVKMDLLALKNLAVIEDTLQLIRRMQLPGPLPHAQPRRDDTVNPALFQGDFIDTMPFDDARVYALLCSTKSVGIFQVESPGMRGLLGRIQPQEFEDLIAQISLFRPGPLKADMITPFVARRHGQEPVQYLHPRLEPVMRRSYGVLIYQEQVLEIAAILAGFDYGQADNLRRAMTHDRSPEEMEKMREQFLDGCRAQGDVSPAEAERAWKILSAFAAYGFCKAHAAAFARTAYQTAWLKRYYPAEFLCSILNNQPMGFYSSHTIAGEAKRIGIPLYGVDINRSEIDFKIELPV